jgi:hypothetical protein
MDSGIEYMDPSKEDIIPRTLCIYFNDVEVICEAKSKDIYLPIYVSSVSNRTAVLSDSETSF